MLFMTDLWFCWTMSYIDRCRAMSHCYLCMYRDSREQFPEQDNQHKRGNTGLQEMDQRELEGPSDGACASLRPLLHQLRQQLQPLLKRHCGRGSCLLPRRRQHASKCRRHLLSWRRLGSRCLDSPRRRCRRSPAQPQERGCRLLPNTRCSVCQQVSCIYFQVAAEASKN